jgi:EAL domain-containing protein (putative c-di-GMP-specific phosphodiesterase class I)
MMSVPIRQIMVFKELDSSRLIQLPENSGALLSSSARFDNLSISSAFQPIFSFSHRRVIGYEALLRAHDSSGNEMPPLSVLNRSVARGHWDNLERSVQLLHASNFAQMAEMQHVLFINRRPAGFIVSEAYRRLVKDSLRRLQLTPNRVVLEVLETPPEGNWQRLVDGIASFRQEGFLIALDDFGVGHSNIDRVWRLKPDIVKLDRSVIEHATQSRRLARVLPRLVSLLHEAGALVVVEGVETEHEALLAIESDADFVQGFFFARPASGKTDEVALRRVMDGLWQLFRERREETARAETLRLSVYISALQAAAGHLVAGTDFALTCHEFLRLEGAARCFILNARGEQVGRDIVATRRCPSPFDICRTVSDGPAAFWERRPYFRNAISQPGTVQVNGPYLSINGERLCITLSVAIRVGTKVRILCADVNWRQATAQRDVADREN